ncbi:hypothetical protein [Laceyella sacchari]|uniref:hypothetical protein n=1 Tax=Laceyella sacchari TaxID=37482 RepID=UPI00105007C1|nr:hypothetical protein [Laceyella sacchari]
MNFVCAVLLRLGHKIICDPDGLAQQLVLPLMDILCTRWFEERCGWKSCSSRFCHSSLPDGEIHYHLPVLDGLLIAVEMPDGKMCKYVVCPPATGWNWLRRMYR